MARQLIKGVLLAAAAFATASTPLLAQVPGVQDAARSWQLAVWFKGGYQQPSGDFAQTQPSDIPGLANYLSQFRVEQAGLMGGGIEVRIPSQSMAARIGWERSGVADAVGRLGICNVLEGPICNPLVASAHFQAITGDLRFLMRRSANRVRPIFLAGAALRQMSIDAPACDPNAEDPRICPTIAALYQDPALHPYARLGLGLEAAPGPLVLNALASIGTGRYSGGNERVNGQWYYEVRIEVSAGYVVY